MNSSRKQNRTNYLLLITALCLVLGLVPAQPARADEHPATALLTHLDLTRPELAAVRDAAASGDPAAAADALKSHFATREAPVFTPVSAATRSSLFSSTAAEMGAGTFRDADGMERDFSSGVDWSDPWTDVDGELGSGHYLMQDFAFVPTLVGEYLSLPEGDPGRVEIADTWMDLSLQYIEDFPEHGLYNRLGEAKRLTQWLTAFSVFRSAPSVDAAELAVFLEYLHGMAHNLYLNVERNNGNNWYISIGRAFYMASVYLPEFSDAAAWERRAEGVADRFIGKHLKADGVQYEPALNYQHYSLSLILQIEEFGKLNGRSPLGNNAPAVERLAEAILGATMPNLKVPLIGDTSNSSLSLAQAANVFERPDMQWVASARASGEEPDMGSVLFPQSFAVMRTGWAPQDAYMFINNQDTNYAASHRHPDDLALTLYAEGRELLVDPGVADYNENPTSVWLRRTTEAHNTVEIDGQPQPSMADGPRERRITEWATNTGFDYFSGFHDDYAPTNHERNVFFAKPGVWIVSDRLTGGDTTHSYRQLWHGPADADVTAVAGRAEIGFGDVPGVVVTDVDDAAMVTYDHGTVTDGSGNLASDVPFVAAEKSATGPTHFDTVLVAGPAGPPVQVETERIPLGTDPVEASAFSYTTGGNKSVHYRSDSPERQERQVGDLRTDAAVLHVEMGSSPTPKSVSMVDGLTVSHESRELVRSTSPMGDLWVRWGSSLQVASSSQLTAPVEIYAPGITNVEFNDVPVEYERIGDHVRITPAEPVPSGEPYAPVFSDDLESEDWTFRSAGTPLEIMQGEWEPVQASDGTWQMHQTSTASSDARIATTDVVGDGTLTSTFTREAAARTHGYGHYQAYQDPENYLLLRVYQLSGATQAEIQQRINGTTTVLASEPVSTNSFSGTALQTSLSNGVASISVDGQQVASAAFVGEPSGTVGLHAHRISGHFSGVSFLPSHDQVWDFTDGVPRQWTAEVGNWESRELPDGTRGYGQADAGASTTRSVVGGQALDMELAATYNPVASSPTMGAGLYLRYQDSGNYHLLRLYRLGGGETMAEIIRASGGTSSIVVSEPVSVSPTSPINLRAIATGDEVRLEVDGEIVAQTLDASPAPGGYGLHLHRTNAVFTGVTARFINVEATEWSFAPPSMDGWQVVSGTWVPDTTAGDRGALRGADTSHSSSIVMHADAPRDVELTTSLVYGGGARTRSAGVHLRYQDPSNNYLLRIYRVNEAYQAEILRLQAGRVTVLASEPVTISTGTPITLRALAVGDMLELWLDGQRVAAAVDDNLSSGGVALSAHKSSASFADISATAVLTDTWQAYRGGARERAGHMHLTGDRPRGALVVSDSSRIWANTEIDATVEGVQGDGSVGIVTRASGKSAGYNFLVHHEDGQASARIELVNQGSNGTTAPVPLASTPITAPGETFQITAQSFKDQLVMLVNGVEVLRTRNALLADGGIGLASSLADVRFTSVSVTPLDLAAQEVTLWSAADTYGAGDLVRHDETLWRAMWHSASQPPGDPNGPWQELSSASAGVPLWTPSRVFTTGDLASHEGHVYTAKWWTRNQAPGTDWGPWEVQD